MTKVESKNKPDSLSKKEKFVYCRSSNEEFKRVLDDYKMKKKNCDYRFENVTFSKSYLENVKNWAWGKNGRTYRNDDM